MDQTLTDVQDSSLTGHPNKPHLKPRPALVLCWSLEEPHRIGEVITLPSQGGSLALGRGDGVPAAPGEATYVRARLMRQRPKQLEQTPPLASRRISRQQLLLRIHDERSVEVENVGRCELLWRRRPVKRCVLAVGDCVTLKNQMVLLCVERSEIMPEQRIEQEGPFHDFGAPDGDGLVGESPATWTLREQISFFARREQHALLLGPSGTGKELVARAIHAHSPRAQRPLIARNAATIPEGLFDAELFGNTKNYPNPGMTERPGLVGEADGSTLFLDEIGELPVRLQSHLLRLLDSDGEYHRLGESHQRSTDLRLIAATNRPIDELKHDFRARFILSLPVPSLNERREDIPLLARFLLKRAAERDPDLSRLYFTAPDDAVLPNEPRIAPELVEALLTHTYTHHVRELEALLWSAITSSSGTWLRLTPAVMAALSLEPFEENEQGEPVASHEDITPEALMESLKRHSGKQSLVWRELKLKNRYVLRRLLKKYDIQFTEAEEDDESEPS